ncbi:MAG: hypothetical protein NT157_01780 [Candidatus Micrarchaeota archaeon]|nr:hypothetical protein [Candidatus Micrarchaeota archaeon]
MKNLFVAAVVLVCVSLLLAGCSQGTPQSPPGGTPPETPGGNPPVNQTPPAPNNTVQPAPPFEPIHLAYKISVPNGPNGQTQRLNFDYYLVEKVDCDGRPALNGFVKTVEASRPEQAGYFKITVYLDSGEAVYSNGIGEPDLAFDGAVPQMLDFDFAFWPETVIARGGKNLLSDEIWNSAKPVLLRNVAAFGGNGDYSISVGKDTTVAGLECRNVTISAKTSNMDGQIVTCVHKLDDLNFSFIASISIIGGPGFDWSVEDFSRDAPSLAYYPQCLAPIPCPSVTKPTQQERDSCGSQGNSLEGTKNSKGCVTKYECLTNTERARRNFVSSQREGCAVDEALVTQNADCWSQQGNVDYGRNEQTGCIVSVTCNPQQQGSGGQMPPGT